MSQLLNLLIHLGENEINLISQQSLNLNYAIYKLYQSNYWWKRKVEVLLNHEYENLEIDWYDLYNKIYNRKTDALYNLETILAEAVMSDNFDTVTVLV